ncbi:hypothetical protein [[Clostridium] fimetarium]|uniref:Uncharacterized protein n=1 Tax=[Clostridium] fimetarium TaxID=99656 RepID=A0A1I0QGP5_9FIRM|nr:hypothetical protein [[Clostridium] fimetarium]SEW26213.1 hypothetical protein SAMN05421659_1085 [[Clostridium] fimetarium]
MILEYLFSDEELKEDILRYKEGKLNISIKNIKDSSFWIAEFIMVGENEQSTLDLSKINDDITERFNCITLTNECAFYFNKILYPLINEFERKLRKILYIASKLSGSATDTAVICDLEKMEFGTLFELIFTDDDFIKMAKTKINAKSWKFTKSELIDDLFSFEEKALWDKLLGIGIAPILRKNFVTMKNYRNNIMHAHNITADVYKQIKKIYLAANQELNGAISDILNNKMVTLFNHSNNDFSETLKEAIDAEKSKKISDNILDNFQMIENVEAVKRSMEFSSISQQINAISEAGKIAMEFSSYSQEIKKLIEAGKLSTELSPINKEIKKLIEVGKLSTELSPINKEIKKLKEAGKLSTELSPINKEIKKFKEAGKLSTELSPINQEIKKLTEVEKLEKQSSFNHHLIARYKKNK